MLSPGCRLPWVSAEAGTAAWSYHKLLRGYGTSFLGSISLVHLYRQGDVSADVQQSGFQKFGVCCTNRESQKCNCRGVPLGKCRKSPLVSDVPPGLEHAGVLRPLPVHPGPQSHTFHPSIFPLLPSSRPFPLHSPPATHR